MNATYQDWQDIRGPRVQAAWHLDEMLPNLDFFIMLSSMLGSCGNVGQAIYAGTAVRITALSFRQLHSDMVWKLMPSA